MKPLDPRFQLQTVFANFSKTLDLGAIIYISADFNFAGLFNLQNSKYLQRHK